MRWKPPTTLVESCGRQPDWLVDVLEAFCVLEL